MYLSFLWFLSAAFCVAATSVSQYGITWTFSADHATGQYANGDYYVVAPSGLTITDITPASTKTATSTVTVTISQADPTVITWVGHGRQGGTPVSFTTTGTLPSPLVVGQTYYTLSYGSTADTFRISSTQGGSALATTSAGSGTHTLEVARIKNGSMVNPQAGVFALMGFDSTLNSSYSEPLNVGRPGGDTLTPSNPLVISAGSSLVSSISIATEYVRPQLSDFAILTIVAAAPASGSFRPPYVGTDKTHYWNKADLNYGILKSLAPVASTPSLATVEANFARSWLEIDTHYTGGETHPLNHQPYYGRDMALALGDGLLSLHLNYTNAQKETLYVRLVQYGIDVYGAAKTGGEWVANGGQNLGRKLPLILAGLALGDSAIQAYGNYALHNIFQEDQQVFVVQQSDVGRAVNDQSEIGRPRLTYTQDLVGYPEWGIEHFYTPYNDGSNWDVIYRNVNFPAFTMHGLAAHLTTGAKSLWNNQTFFDYIDRAKFVSSPSEFGTFTKNMWQSYRSMGGALWTPPASPRRTKPAGASLLLRRR